MKKIYRVKKNNEIKDIIDNKKFFSNKYFTVYKMNNLKTTHFRYAINVGKKIGKDCSKVFFDKLTGTTWKTRGYGRYYYYVNGEYKGCYDDYSDALTGY